RLYARAGARVVLGARRVERLDALVAEIGPAAMAVAMDVTDEASIIAGFDAAQARFGTPDTVLANAGMAEAGRAIDLGADQVRRVIDTNFTA
ncbi:SDR family oxidoreductase, partial [Salmonella enterica]|uniref:SDR family oxidoreductase n=1 Tax=Salmonella enterica TaxID=28901 RepID=UPI003D2D600C